MADSVHRNQSVRAHFLKSLIAVVAGNAIYFLLLMPRLPAAGRHGIARLDLGLLIDFWVCVLVYGVMELIAKTKRRQQ